MKATITLTDKPGGRVNVHCEFSEPVDDTTESGAASMAIEMMQNLNTTYEEDLMFHGATYYYPTPNEGTQVIGVCRGLGEDWIVGYRRPGTGSTRRVKTPNLPPMPDPAALQEILDDWAAERGLEEVV